MAGYFKKRRTSQGPNKNEEKVLRARQARSAAESAGPLGSKFPAIKSLAVHLTFLDRQRVLEERDLSFSPSDPALFTVPCPGRCGRGAFDFGGKVAETAAALAPLSESGAKCAEPLYASSPDLCGCELRCRMELAYFPSETPDPPQA